MPGRAFIPFVLCAPLLLLPGALLAISGGDTGRDEAMPVEFGLDTRVTERPLSTGEPTVVVSPGGGIHVVAPERPAALWKSADGGRSFARLADSLGGAGDADLAFGPDDVLYVSDLFDRNGRSTVPVSTSLDGGRSFARVVASAPGASGADRQWLATAGAGVVLSSWREGEQFRLSVSRDWGATFSTPLSLGRTSVLGPFVKGPGGTLHVAATEGSRVLLFESADGGATWTAAHVGRRGGLEMVFPVAAVDAGGNAYVVWADGDFVRQEREGHLPAGAPYARVRLAVRPAGETEFRPAVLLGDLSRSAVFPWMVAGDAGRVAVVFLEASDRVLPDAAPPVTEWRVVLAHSLDAAAGDASFSRVVVTPDAVHFGSVCTFGSICSSFRTGLPTPLDRRLLDYVSVATDADGNAIVAYAKDSTPGSSAVHLHVAVQTAGPRLREG